MTKEQMAEKIRLEYALYEATDCLTREALEGFIWEQHNELDGILSGLPEQKTSNNINGAFSRALGKYRDKKGLFEPSYYEQDTRLLELAHDVVWNYRRCFFILADRLNDENLDEINRLAKFTYDSYSRNYEAVCVSRRIVKPGGPGLAMTCKMAPMDFRGFMTFFEEKIKAIPKKVECRAAEQEMEEDSEELLEKLKLEYSLLTVPDVYRLETVLGCIQFAHEACISWILELWKRKCKNSFESVVSFALGSRREEFGYMIPSNYWEDNAAIDLQIAMAKRCLGYYEQLYESANDDNIAEIYRLACFTAGKHGYNDVAVRMMRDINKNHVVDASFVATSVEINSPAFDDFFGETLRAARKVENPQFSKK